jgi:hypothetical protein
MPANLVPVTGNVPSLQAELQAPTMGALPFALGLRMILIPLLSETHETQCAKPGGLSTSRPPTVGGSGAYRYRQKYQYVPGIEAMNGRNNT